MTAAHAVALRAGPLPTGEPALEIEFADGRRVLVELTTEQAGRLADRLRECVDGRICSRPPSRRVLELALVSDGHSAPPHSGVAVVPDLQADLERQAPL